MDSYYFIFNKILAYEYCKSYLITPCLLRRLGINSVGVGTGGGRGGDKFSRSASAFGILNSTWGILESEKIQINKMKVLAQNSFTPSLSLG